MSVQYLGSEKEWRKALAAIRYNIEEIDLQLEDIFNEENPSTISLRILAPGKSGAQVFAACIDLKSNDQSHWVIKIVPKSLLTQLQKELISTRNYAKMLYANAEIRNSLGCIAVRYRQVEKDLGAYLNSAATRQDLVEMIKKTFRILEPWYANTHKEVYRFIDVNQLTTELECNLRNHGKQNLVDYWEAIKAQWPITNTCLSTICHGDFHQHNILIGHDGTPCVIDFGLTGYNHWATDFVRLERQIKFMVTDDFPDSMSQLVDTNFDFEIPDDIKDTRSKKVLAAIAEIRRQARLHFEAKLNVAGSNEFLKEYFSALIFQQLRLLGSDNWQKTDALYNQISDSTERLFYQLLLQNPTDFYFGYIYTIVDGKERVLLERTNERKWKFPICGVVPRNSESVEFTINAAVREFFSTDLNRQSNFIKSGFGRIEINPIIENNAHASIIDWEGEKLAITPYFFKIYVNNLFEIEGNNYFWSYKGISFNGIKDSKQTIECDQTQLNKLIKCDFVREEYGRRVLECCDIIVFREKADDSDQDEFLMLLRKNTLDKWEYPKGGMEYHETGHEGAIRELLEETGIQNINDFIPGGELGYQTADVGWRKNKFYDTLRVRGLVYYFAGKDSEMEMIFSTPNDMPEHDAFKWMSFQEAHENIWIGDYGKKFLELWQKNRYQFYNRISRPVSIAYQITEDCRIGCKFCHRAVRDEPPMDFDRIRKLIDVLKERSVHRLTFTGGEPLEHKTLLFQAIKYAHDTRIHTCLTTTGIKLNLADLDELDTCLDQILLPIHTITPETYSKLFEFENTGRLMHRKAEEFLQQIKTKKIKLDINTVVTKANIKEIVALGRWIFNLNNDVRWRVEEYYPNGQQTEDDVSMFIVSDKEFSSLIDEISEDDILSVYYSKGLIRVSTKKSRSDAPDIMITPQGNLVTSCENKYEERGTASELQNIEFKNRRPWSDYEMGVRNDWDW